MILGGTDIGARVALQLSQEKDKHVKLVESNRARAEELAEELRQLLGEWERMSEVMERLGPKQGPLSLQLRERYGDSVDPELSFSQEEEQEGGPESDTQLPRPVTGDLRNVWFPCFDPEMRESPFRPNMEGK